MDIVKGFVTIDAYVNNNPGIVSLLGELSTWSRTYSREKGEYLDSNIPGFKLTTFRVSDSDNGIQKALVPSQVTQILQIVKDCIDYAQSHIRPYDPNDFRNTILANFHIRIENLNMGAFIDNGFIALPQWISWDSKEHNNAFVRVWLVDEAFQDQYDEHHITVIPPVERLDDLFSIYSTAVGKINERSLTDMMELIQEAKNEHPETYIRLQEFDFVNTLNTNQKTKTNWGILIYGKNGDNVDSIKDAIIDFVLANSTHTRSEWETIFPDLFKRTEFVFLPRWDKTSIPNLGQLANLYSSILDPRECIEFAKEQISFYDDAFIELNTNIFPYDYKALSIVSVNGNNNLEGARNLYEVFPDYIPIPSTSPDFNRMQLRTREWVIFIQNLIIAAETANDFTSVSNPMRKQLKGGILFISGIFDNINYLVAAKSNSFYND